jgi:[ribosomal protein S18]-alanine N-acetyltransferase
MTQDYAVAIASWRYASEADVETYAGDREDVLRSAGRGAWRAVIDDDDSLLGFFRYEHRDEETVMIGAGLRPELVGRGLGLQFVDTGLAYASRAWQPKRFVVRVPVANGRVRRLFDRAGFTVVARMKAPLLDGRSLDVVEFAREE